jgi:hypothetical protein
LFISLPPVHLLLTAAGSSRLEAFMMALYMTRKVDLLVRTVGGRQNAIRAHKCRALCTVPPLVRIEVALVGGFVGATADSTLETLLVVYSCFVGSEVMHRASRIRTLAENTSLFITLVKATF